MLLAETGKMGLALEVVEVPPPSVRIPSCLYFVRDSHSLHRTCDRQENRNRIASMLLPYQTAQLQEFLAASALHILAYIAK